MEKMRLSVGAAYSLDSDLTMTTLIRAISEVKGTWIAESTSSVGYT
jgi:hypothetical protein